MSLDLKNSLMSLKSDNLTEYAILLHFYFIIIILGGPTPNVGLELIPLSLRVACSTE